MIVPVNGGNSRPRRIGIVHPGMDVKGGAENIVVWLADGLRARGYEVRILTDRFDRSLWPEEMVGGLDVRLFPNFRLSRLINSKRLQLWERSYQLARMLRGFDLVIAQHFPTYCWATRARYRPLSSWRVLWLCQEPTRRLYFNVTDTHLMEYKKFAPPDVPDEFFELAVKQRLKIKSHRRNKFLRNINWDSWSVKRCDMVLANSAFTAGNVGKIFSIEPEVCHLGIPLPDEREYVSGDYLAVLTTFNPLKNVHNVIRAVPLLLRRPGCEGIKMRIAGQGRERKRLEELAGMLGVADRVEFVGRISDDDLPDFFRNARAVVYCPIDEPFGLVPLEALAQKTPVVVSNHGGPAETVAHGETGIHVNPFDARDIAAGIAELVQDDAKNRRMAEEGNRKIRDYFSLDAFLNRFEEIIAGGRISRTARGSSPEKMGQSGFSAPRRPLKNA